MVENFSSEALAAQHQTCPVLGSHAGQLLPGGLGAILEKFDLARYQAAYKLPPEEYEAMKRDLPEVLESLRNYLADKLAPPMDKDNWGFTGSDS